jgi:hypothetical protein
MWGISTSDISGDISYHQLPSVHHEAITSVSQVHKLSKQINFTPSTKQKSKLDLLVECRFDLLETSQSMKCWISFFVTVMLVSLILIGKWIYKPALVFQNYLVCFVRISKMYLECNTTVWILKMLNILIIETPVVQINTTSCNPSVALRWSSDSSEHQLFTLLFACCKLFVIVKRWGCACFFLFVVSEFSYNW